MEIVQTVQNVQTVPVVEKGYSRLLQVLSLWGREILRIAARNPRGCPPNTSRTALYLIRSGGTEHGVLLVTVKAFAGGKLRHIQRSLMDVIKYFLASTCIDQGLCTVDRITEIGVADSRSDDEVYGPPEELL
jgi:type II secretory pathway component PulJ